MTPTVVCHVWSSKIAYPPNLIDPSRSPSLLLGLRYLAIARSSDVPHLASLVMKVEGIPAHAKYGFPVLST